MKLILMPMNWHQNIGPFTMEMPAGFSPVVGQQIDLTYPGGLCADGEPKQLLGEFTDVSWRMVTINPDSKWEGVRSELVIDGESEKSLACYCTIRVLKDEYVGGRKMEVRREG